MYKVDDETRSVNQRRTNGSRTLPNNDVGRATLNTITLPVMINIESSKSGRIVHQTNVIKECDVVEEGDVVGVEDMETQPEHVTLIEVVEVEPGPANPVEDMVFQLEPAVHVGKKPFMSRQINMEEPEEVVNDVLLDNNQIVEGDETVSKEE